MDSFKAMVISFAVLMALMFGAYYLTGYMGWVADAAP